MLAYSRFSPYIHAYTISNCHQMQFTCTGTLYNRIEQKNKDEKKAGKKHAIHFCACIEMRRSIKANLYQRFILLNARKLTVFFFTQKIVKSLNATCWALMCRLSYILWVQWWNPTTGWDRAGESERLWTKEKRYETRASHENDGSYQLK